MGVQHHARTGDAVDRRVDALRRKLDHAFTLQRRARLVEHDHVARPRLRPVQAEGQNQIAVVAAGHRDREMVVDAFLELVQNRQPMRGRKVDLCFADRIGGSAAGQRMNGHDGPPTIIYKRDDTTDDAITSPRRGAGSPDG